MDNNQTSLETKDDRLVKTSREKKRSNMHEGIAVWCDCCSCEAEPYWREVADELGIDLSEYEDE